MKLFISILFLIPCFGFAQSNDFVVDDSRVVEENPGDTGTIGLTSGTAPSNEPELGNAGENLGETGGFNVTQQGGLDGTNAAQGSGSQVNLMGLAMGAAFMRPCTKPGGQWACAAAAMSFADALSGRSANQAAYQTGTYFDPNHGTGTGTDDNGFGSVETAQAEEQLQGLSEMGYTVNGDGSVTMPDGSSVTASDLSSMEGLTGSGMSPEAASQFMNNMNNIKSAAAKKAGLDLEKVEAESAVANAGGAFKGLGNGGSGVGDSSTGGGDTYIEEVEYRKKSGKKKRMPASEAAKLSKNFNGDPIGIGMADLFLIVHQKYKEKKNKKTEFIRREY